MSSPRRPVLVLFAVTCAILVGWFGWRIYGDYLVRADLSAARRSIALSDRATARDRLRHAAAIRPDHGEVQLLLGTMAIEDGHPDEAESAWAQVPEDSPYAPDAATYRARLAFRQDQFAHAEDLLKAGLRGKGGLALEARQALTALYKIEGRFDEAKKLILDGWQSYPDPARQVRELEVLGSTTPVPVAEVRRALEQAERKNPADDRVALGWANVAIRTGRIDEAKTRLDSCLNLRPDDPAVWRALLDWAEARQDPVEAERALHHLPEEALNPTQVLALQAWFAALEGDSEREKQAYEALVLRDPGYLKAWDRLSDLALQAGRTEQAARLRERRVEVSQARTEYTAQFLGGTSATDPIGTARVAETLGRWFEAATIWSTVLKADPTNSTAREAITRLAGLEANAPTGPKIAELVAELTAHPPSKRDSGPSGGPGITSNPTTPPIRFTERAEASGLRFTFDNGATPARQMPETMAGGVGLIDFDGDGWLDVFLPQGGSFPPPTDRPAPGGDRLFHNRGDGTFEDATDSSGLARLSQGFGHGVAVGDFDGDGHPDVFVTRWNRYSLYRNRGNGTFEDATVGAGLAGDRDWPTSAAWADLDRDGDLDLYVCHYLQWDTANPRLCFDSRVGRNSYCGPTGFASLPDHLFRNDGGRFTDVTAEAGIIDTDGRGLGVVVADLDGDGRLDLFVANDQSANFVWHNLGGMKFAEVGLASGLATNGDGNFQASMGVATADFDGDGKLDLAKTNFFNESMTLYQNRGAGLFADVTTATGLAAPTRFLLGFGAKFRRLRQRRLARPRHHQRPH